MSSFKAFLDINIDRSHTGHCGHNIDSMRHERTEVWKKNLQKWEVPSLTGPLCVGKLPNRALVSSFKAFLDINIDRSQTVHCGHNIEGYQARNQKDRKQASKESGNWTWRAFISTLCYNRSFPPPSLDMSSPSYLPQYPTSSSSLICSTPPPSMRTLSLLRVCIQGGKWRCESPKEGGFIPQLLWIKCSIWNPVHGTLK